MAAMSHAEMARSCLRCDTALLIETLVFEPMQVAEGWTEETAKANMERLMQGRTQDGVLETTADSIPMSGLLL